MKETLISKSERTRQFIIEKTAPVFNKKGVAGTSLSDLTRATGLTKGSIYGNFKNKDDLAQAVFQYSIDNLTRFMARQIEKAGTPVEKLLAVADAYRKLYHPMISYGGCPILNTAAEADDTHKALSNLAVEAINQLQAVLIDLVNQGKNDGQIDPDADADRFARIAMALVEGGLMLSKLTGSRNYLMSALDQLEDKIREMADMT